MEKENNVTAVSEVLLSKANTVKTAEEELANNIYEAIGANTKTVDDIGNNLIFKL